MISLIVRSKGLWYEKRKIDVLLGAIMKNKWFKFFIVSTFAFIFLLSIEDLIMDKSKPEVEFIKGHKKHHQAMASYDKGTV